MFSLNSPKSGAHSFLFLKKAYKMEAPTQHFTLDFPDPVSSHSKSNYSAERRNCHYAIYVFGEKKNNSQSRGCQLPKPNKAQTTTASWQNPFRSNKNLGAESCSCFPWLHLVSVTASSSQGAVGCQICSRRAYSKMHVQPLCQDVDVPVMTKKFPETASLFNFIFHGWLVGVSPQWATWAPDCWLDCFILSQIYRQGILLQLIKLPLFVSQLLMYCMYFRLPVCHHKETTEPESSYDLTTLKVFKMNVVSCISGGLSAVNARKSP